MFRSVGFVRFVLVGSVDFVAWLDGCLVGWLNGWLVTRLVECMLLFNTGVYLIFFESPHISRGPPPTHNLTLKKKVCNPMDEAMA